MASSLGTIAATVTLNVDPFTRNSNILKNTIKTTSTALKAQEAAFKTYGSSLTSLKTNYSTMQQQMKQYQDYLKEETKALEKNKAAQDQDASVQAKHINNINRTKASMAQLDSEMMKVNKTIALQSSAWTKVSKVTATFGAAASSAGQKMSSLGSTMTTRVTAPIVAGFGYAAKSAVDFNSQIANIGPLLKANGESASQVKNEMTQMADASKKWSTQYGISTDKINNAMEELVKRGYSANQTMGAMPSILNAAKASGDDFTDVMKVSTSTLEQFGLKSNTTAGMLKNTQRVTDSLTYTANATAAGFQDMGDAMTYVGPTAHAAGLSLEETASAIGLMSNQGIEGSVAGTALRSALTRLMKPSKQNAEGFKELGINVADFKNHSLTLPEILTKIKTNTAGWTKEQRAAAIATAFGTEAQAGMNALVSEGGGALTELTNKTEKATGSTKKIAETMNNTSAAQVARFKESLHVLAITVGEKLTPTLMPLVKNLTNVVKKFSEMDSSTQQSIIKWAALAAAAGPVLSIFGKLTSTVGATSTAISVVTGGFGRLSAASSLGFTGFQKLTSMFSKNAFEATKVKAGIDVATEATEGVGNAAVKGATKTGLLSKVFGSAGLAATGMSSAIVPAGLAIAGTAAVVAGGIWAWNSWGKQALESAKETSKWGTTVGKKADTALTHFRDFNTQSSDALKQFDSNSSQSASSISKSFKGMSDQISDTAKDANKKLKDGLKDLPDDVADIVDKAADKQKNSNNKIKNNAKQTSDNVNDIVKNAAKKHRGLTDDENQYILNSKKKMNDDEIELLGISGKKKSQIEKALNADVSKMNKFQINQNLKTISQGMSKEQDAYKKQASTIKSLYKKGLISKKEYSKAMNILDSDQTKSMDKQGKKYIELAKAAGYSTGDIKSYLKDLGVSYDDAAKYSEKSSKKVETANSRIADTSKKMGKVAKAASDEWNDMVLDPKTGRIKTDAQKTINDTAKTEEGWSQLKFELKHANIGTNAKSMIGVAAIQAGRWNDLSWEEKDAMLRVQGKPELEDIVSRIKDWDKMTPKQQEAIVRAKGKADLAAAMISANEWNQMKMKDKKALVKSEGSRDLVDLLTSSGQWNNLSLKAQKAVVSGKGNGELMDTLLNMGKWNDLTPEEKDMVIHDKATQGIVSAMVATGQWNSLTVDQKTAVMNDHATATTVSALYVVGEWDKLTPQEKDAVVNDKATGKMINAIAQMGLWDGLDPQAKDAIVNDKASAPIVAALVQNGKWNNLPAAEKDAIINTGKSAVDLANLVSSYGGFGDLPDAQKNIIVNSDEAMQRLYDAGYTLTRYDMKKPELKKLYAENKDVLDKTKKGEKAVVTYNGKKMVVKKMKGDNVQFVGEINDSNKKTEDYNKKKPNKKKFTGDASGAKKAAKEAGDATEKANRKKPTKKNFKATDNVSKSAGAAVGAIANFMRLPNTTTKIMRNITENIVRQIFQHKSGTRDSGDEIAMVNDETGSTFRELIKFPNGQTMIPSGRNVLVKLPRHSQVVPAHETNRMLGGIPQFATGTPGYSKVVNEFTNMNPGMTHNSTNTTNTSTKTNNSSVNNQFHVEVTVNSNATNGADLGQQTADIIEAKLRDIFNNQSTAFGGGSIA
ncbi:phage tail tape measure protein [Companilactobacillus mishanensis]|uniref:Phage tail tape measure protein n=1 Tax=Companilactobacillus mishanensis TaxID=2486008 RepID=A0A5P0ZGM0_9LACO|nr:phage tail tape measure protein [Companilactobacillus mishanensis]MQS52174.1 phage tail tape measure protein [Companilactobacillus mishanensis]